MPNDTRLTRRQLLAGAAGAGAGAVLLRGAGAIPPAAAQAPPPMLKGASLIGDVNPYDDSLAVRPYLLGGPRRTEFVSFWVSWRPTQPHRPDPLTAEQSWSELSDPAFPAAAAWDALDAQIAQANADGMQVALTLYQSFPEWTHPSTGCLMPALDPQAGGPGYEGQGRAANGARIPDDRSPGGPFAWFVDYLCARYSDTGGEATPGPGRAGATVGNPRAAKVQWLAPCNEPNLTWWPQTSDDYPDGTLASAVAELMRTATTVAARHVTAAPTPRGPSIMGPNASDVLDPDDLPERGTAWRPFTEGVLRNLAGWQPEAPVGWAHHNYMDVKYGPQPRGSGRWRVEELLDLLREHRWAGGEDIWLTEGGYTFGVRKDGPDPGRYLVDPAKTASDRYADVFAEQNALLQANWEAMAALPAVRLWSQYQVNDRDVRFQSGLRGPVRDQPDGSRALNDPPYPAYDLWPRLGA